MSLIYKQKNTHGVTSSVGLRKELPDYMFLEVAGICLGIIYNCGRPPFMC